MIINLKKFRAEFGVLQKTLAEAVRISQQSVNKYETHNIEPDIETMIRIADFFGTFVDYLTGHADMRMAVDAVHRFELTEGEKRLLKRYRMLTNRQKACANILIDRYFMRFSTYNARLL